MPYDYTVEVTNRFKGLDLIDRVPEELWMYVCDIGVIKNIRKKKKCKKVTWLSEEALQIAEKRREAKGKGQNENGECGDISQLHPRPASLHQAAAALILTNRGWGLPTVGFPGRRLQIGRAHV